MAATIPVTLTKESRESLRQYFRACREPFLSETSMRDQFEVVDRQYTRETDLTSEEFRAKQFNRYWDPTKFRNVILPLTYAGVEAAVAYQASVFLSGVPMFGCVSDPQFISEALQLEAIIGEQQRRGRWVSEFQMFFRDGFKYNLAAMEVEWRKTTVPVIDTDITSGSANLAKARQVSYEGNYLCRRDLYNMFWDRRCDPWNLHTEGEFAGYTEVWSRVKLKAYVDSHAEGGKQPNFMKEAFESSSENEFYIPQIVSELFQDKKDNLYPNWDMFVGLLRDRGRAAFNYKNYYEISRIYARIIPKEHGIIVPAPNTPQIWSFMLINGSIPLYAERMTNFHNNLPLILCQPNQDGLGYQSKSLARNIEVFQHVGSSLVNMDVASRRRAISDRVLYDPSRIAAKDINSDNPAAKIPIRPSVYGKPVQDAVFPFPYREDQQGFNIQMLGTLMNFSNQIAGQNPVRQGQFVKGNKTKKEFEDVMGNATNRDQLAAMIIEEQAMVPIKEMLKVNILQYQGSQELFSYSAKQQVNIDPVALRKAVLAFKISDGLVPSEKLISGDEWMTGLQIIGSSPQIAAGYNISPLFGYLMKIRGADLSPFEKSPAQVAYEQAMAQWSQVASLIVQQNMKAEKPQPIPPQPTPQQFGWNPNEQSPGSVQPVQSDSGGGTGSQGY